MNGSDFKKAIISGAHAIINHKSEIDDLNIFPVPDGDTGTNMSMTIQAAVDELVKVDYESIAEGSQKVASAMLRGARGNAGVILSLLFCGFAKGLKDKEIATARDLVYALSLGVEAAYQAVKNTIEGTILTVARIACEEGKEAVIANEDLIYVWSAICNGAKEALEDTPNLLPVLKKAGVVDAGGKGLCLILDGMFSVIRNGKEVPLEKKNGKDDFFRSAISKFDENINFTYCTEFIVERSLALNSSEEVGSLQQALEVLGDSVLVVEDPEIIKVHVHTENPGDALQNGLHFGQLLTVKIENMKKQHENAVEENKSKSKKIKQHKQLKWVDPVHEIGFVAVATGEGFHTLFTDLGCAHVITGGQSMNPSTNDIVSAILATSAKQVVVLPNNKNIILAAEQAIPLITDRKVVVLPSRTIPQGISAMLSFDPDLNWTDNMKHIIEVMKHVSTGQVTFATRDAAFGSQKIQAGDILGLHNGKMEFVEKDQVKTVVKLVRSMVNRSTSFVAIFYGEDISENQATEALNQIRDRIPENIEISLMNGGQSIYYFIISVE